MPTPCLPAVQKGAGNVQVRVLELQVVVGDPTRVNPGKQANEQVFPTALLQGKSRNPFLGATMRGKQKPSVVTSGNFLEDISLIFEEMTVSFDLREVITVEFRVVFLASPDILSKVIKMQIHQEISGIV